MGGASLGEPQFLEEPQTVTQR